MNEQLIQITVSREPSFVIGRNLLALLLYVWLILHLQQIQNLHLNFKIFRQTDLLWFTMKMGKED